MKISKENRQNFAVAGNPVSHSLSPVLFSNFARQVGKNYFYSRILADNAERIMEIAESFDLKGLNITAPFKKDILQFVDKRSENVKFLDAANTIVFNNDIKAYNSDIDGVSNSLKNFVEKDHMAIVLGAGGAAKATVLALQKLGIKDIFIANRTYEKAKIIANNFGIKQIPFENTGNRYYGIIVNTIPTYIDTLEGLKIDRKSIILDANYKNKPFAKLATKYNAKYISGFQWLIEQGIESYYKMTGLKIDDLKISDEEIAGINHKSKRIALIGSMASGKSKIGRRLAELLGYEFMDMDDIIVENEKRSINEIFEKSGERYFRKIEKELLKSIIAKEQIVISTGGGIIKDEQNIDLLTQNCWNILLYASPEVRSSRINVAKRPLLNGKDVKAIMKKLFSERKDKYFKTADVIINRNDNNLNKDIKLIYEDYRETFGV